MEGKSKKAKGKNRDKEAVGTQRSVVSLNLFALFATTLMPFAVRESRLTAKDAKKTQRAQRD
jgi:hypothetical protein